LEEIMSEIRADAEMARQIATADGPVNIVDATGTLIAVCTPVKFPHSPYTREEVEAAREEARRNPGGGKSLAEIMARLQHLAGEQS
jgi:hypothetical protein